MAVFGFHASEIGHLAEIDRVRRDSDSRTNRTLDPHEIVQERLYVAVRLNLIDRASFAEVARGLSGKSRADICYGSLPGILKSNRVL